MSERRQDAEREPVTALRELQLVELDILKEVVRICEKHGLRYYLLGGTFLGAVRHKGFIPWDDDIDIGMPRPDYEEFMRIAIDSLPEHMTYRNFRIGNEDTIYFSRVENSSIQVEDSSAIEKRIRSAWIDIFPLDGMPKNVILRIIKKGYLLHRRLLLQYSQFNRIVNQDLPGRPRHERILIRIGKAVKPERFFDTKKSLKKLDKVLRSCDYESSDYVVNFMGAYKFKEMFPKKIYEKTAKYLFETEMLTAPSEYEYVLTQMYGEYMNPPKESERNKHHIQVIRNDGSGEKI